MSLADNFVKIDYSKKEQQFTEFLNNCKSEDDMLEDDIKKIIIKALKNANYEVNTERNPTVYNEHPFDVIGGLIKKFDDGTEAVDIIGFEIKSDRDNYSRLKQQIDYYLAYCDSVYIVVHKKTDIPEWLPDTVGVLRVNKNGEILQESWAITNRWYEKVGGITEWSILMSAHGLGSKTKTLQDIFDFTPKIWKKCLFNRFFGKINYTNREFEKLFPFTKEETEFIIGHQLDYQLDIMTRMVGEIKRLAITTEDYLKIMKPTIKGVDKVNINIGEYLTKRAKESDNNGKE